MSPRHFRRYQFNQHRPFIFPTFPKLPITHSTVCGWEYTSYYYTWIDPNRSKRRRSQTAIQTAPKGMTLCTPNHQHQINQTNALLNTLHDKA